MLKYRSPIECHAVTAGEHVGIKLVRILGDGIGRKRPADHVFHLGQSRMVAVGGARRGINEALDLGVAGRHQHVDETRDIGLVGRQGVLDRARHRAQRRMMQHVSPRRSQARRQSARSRMSPSMLVKLRHAVSPTNCPHLLQIAGIAGREVVEAHDRLPELEQCLQQIGADETGDPGDQPAARTAAQLTLLDFLVSGRHVSTTASFTTARP